MECLKQYLKKLGHCTIAFSGGVDSSVLAYIARRTVPSVALTIHTKFNTQEELERAKEIAKLIGIEHKVIENELDDEVLSNPKDRCYFCKQRIFKKIMTENLLDGTNADDDPARPGLRAIAELGVHSPLKECGITKQQVRQYAKEFGLPNWNLPSNSCLATRIPAGTRITDEMLQAVDSTEQILHRMGILDVRARLVGKTMNIEMHAKDFNTYRQSESEILRHAHKLGYEVVLHERHT